MGSSLDALVAAATPLITDIAKSTRFWYVSDDPDVSLCLCTYVGGWKAKAARDKFDGGPTRILRDSIDEFSQQTRPRGGFPSGD